MSVKVSVIIPCFNYANFIEQCIMSVLLQKVNYNIEIIVSDDNSSDISYDIANRMKYFHESESVKFKILKNQNNLGEILNTKKLLEEATGEYIAYIDADDYWIDPNKLQVQTNFLDKNTDHSLCITGYLALENGNILPGSNLSSFFCPPNLDNLNSEGLVYGNSVNSSSSRVFRNYKNLYKDYFLDFPYSDWVINFELSRLGKIAYINIPSYVYRVHTNSLSRKEEVDAIEKYQKRVSILSDILKK